MISISTKLETPRAAVLSAVHERRKYHRCSLAAIVMELRSRGKRSGDLHVSVGCRRLRKTSEHVKLHDLHEGFAFCWHAFMTIYTMDPSEVRFRFLQDAAHLLAVSSPAAAASLGSASDKLIVDASLNIAPKEYDVHRRETCGACGNLMVPGWSCKIVKLNQRDGSREKQGAMTALPTNAQSSTAYQCSRCHRETVQILPPKPQRQMRKSKARIEPDTVPDIKSLKKEVIETPTKTVNASSKQRQKARKGGLQAMLEKNKSQQSNLGGLDLMDFAM